MADEKEIDLKKLGQRIRSLRLGKGWSLGVAPLIAIDLAKAIIASGLAEAARSGVTRATGAW